MSSKDKLIKKLKSKPKDFTWDELTRLLGALNFSIGISKFVTRKIINQLFKNSFNKYVVTSHNIRNYQHFYKNFCQNLSKNRFSFTNYVAET